MLIDELERMCVLLAAALAEELSSRPAPSPSITVPSFSSIDLAVEDLLALISIGSLFDRPRPPSGVVAIHDHHLAFPELAGQPPP